MTLKLMIVKVFAELQSYSCGECFVLIVAASVYIEWAYVKVIQTKSVLLIRQFLITVLGS
jgi:hypothetical protein